MFNGNRIHYGYMNQAFRLAETAYEQEEVPVGAVVVHQDRIIGRKCWGMLLLMLK